MIRSQTQVLVMAIVLSAGLAAAQSQEAAPYRILAYGESNTWGWTASADGIPTRRLPALERWTGRLAETQSRHGYLNVGRLLRPVRHAAHRAAAYR